MNYDSGDESQVKGRNKKADKAIEREKRQIRQAWNNPACRAELLKVVLDSGIHARTFVPGKPDVAAYNEGARELGLKVYERVMSVCPELFQLAQNEAGQPQEENETDE